MPPEIEEDVEVTYCETCNEELEPENQCICTTCGQCGWYGPGADGAYDMDGHCCNCGSDDDYCQCCSTCGFSTCECCGACENYPCSCSEEDEEDEEYRNSWNGCRPALVEGITIEEVVKARKSYGVPVDDERIAAGLVGLDPADYDPVQAMGEFYILEYITHGLGLAPGMAHEFDVEFVILEAKKEMDKLVKKLDKPFQLYVDMACGGELRHHPFFKSEAGFQLKNMRCWAWLDWLHIRKVQGTDALLQAAEMFEEFGDGSFGGRKWAEGCRALHMRLTNQISKEMWLDRVFNLEHNGGCFLNKLNWGCFNEPGWTLPYMQGLIGPAHGTNPVSFGPLLAVSRPEVRKLLAQYFTGINAVAKAWKRPDLRQTQPRITDQGTVDKLSQRISYSVAYTNAAGYDRYTDTVEWVKCPFVPPPSLKELLPRDVELVDGDGDRLLVLAIKAYNDGRITEALTLLWSSFAAERFPSWNDHLESLRLAWGNVHEQDIPSLWVLRALEKACLDVQSNGPGYTSGGWTYVEDYATVYRRLTDPEEEEEAEGYVRRATMKKPSGYSPTCACDECKPYTHWLQNRAETDPQPEPEQVDSSTSISTGNTISTSWVEGLVTTVNTMATHGDMWVIRPDAPPSLVAWDAGDELPSTGVIHDYSEG